MKPMAVDEFMERNGKEGMWAGGNVTQDSLRTPGWRTPAALVPKDEEHEADE